MTKKKKVRAKYTVWISLHDAISVIKQYASVDRKGPALDAVKKDSDNLRLKFFEPIYKGNGKLIWGNIGHRESIGSIPIKNASVYARLIH